MSIIYLPGMIVARVLEKIIGCPCDWNAKDLEGNAVQCDLHVVR